MILGMHHAAIAVPNMQAGLDFYCDVLGFEVCDQASLPPGIAVLAEAFGLDDAGCEVRMIRKGGSFLELFEFATALDRMCVCHDPCTPYVHSRVKRNCRTGGETGQRRQKCKASAKWSVR